jgi:hypothetical protein
MIEMMKIAMKLVGFIRSLRLYWPHPAELDYFQIPPEECSVQYPPQGSSVQCPLEGYKTLYSSKSNPGLFELLTTSEFIPGGFGYFNTLNYRV